MDLCTENNWLQSVTNVTVILFIEAIGSVESWVKENSVVLYQSQNMDNTKSMSSFTTNSMFCLK